MGKYSNLIAIVNLLHTRKVVTGRQIREKCDVASRTVLRYIRDLSEANVPVHFDRKLGGYTLTEANPGLLEALTMDELVSILFALRYTALRMNDAHNIGINELVRKLISRQKHDIDDILDNVTANLTAEEPARLLSQRLNLISIQVAAAMHREVRMTVRSVDGTENWRISEPSLRFKMGWQVCGTRADQQIAIPMEQIESVQVMS